MSRRTDDLTIQVAMVPPRADSGGYVYFWLCDTAEPAVKIGYAKNLSTRLSEGQIGCPYRLHLTAWFWSDAPARDELILHGRFKHLSMRGEWFGLGDDLRAAIVECRSIMSSAIECLTDGVVIRPTIGTERPQRRQHVTYFRKEFPEHKGKRVRRGSWVWRGKERPL